MSYQITKIKLTLLNTNKRGVIGYANIELEKNFGIGGIAIIKRERSLIDIQLPSREIKDKKTQELVMRDFNYYISEEQKEAIEDRLKIFTIECMEEKEKAGDITKKVYIKDFENEKNEVLNVSRVMAYIHRENYGTGKIGTAVIELGNQIGVTGIVITYGKNRKLIDITLPTKEVRQNSTGRVFEMPYNFYITEKQRITIERAIKIAVRNEIAQRETSEAKRSLAEKIKQSTIEKEEKEETSVIVKEEKEKEEVPEEIEPIDAQKLAEESV